MNYLNNMVYVHKAGPVWLIGWGTTTMDAETVYVPLFRSGNIFANWHNEDFNRMVDEAQTIMDEKKRLDEYWRINKLWVEETRRCRSTSRSISTASQAAQLEGAQRRVLKAYDMSLKPAS